MEDLYKHTLETLLSENSDDIRYFHDNVCSDKVKVQRVTNPGVDLKCVPNTSIS